MGNAYPEGHLRYAAGHYGRTPDPFGDRSRRALIGAIVLLAVAVFCLAVAL
jgi:hypothetical protein